MIAVYNEYSKKLQITALYGHRQKRPLLSLVILLLGTFFGIFGDFLRCRPAIHHCWKIFVDMQPGNINHAIHATKSKAEFILERKRFFLSLCHMCISLFPMGILVCEVEKWKRACEKAIKNRLRC